MASPSPGYGIGVGGKDAGNGSDANQLLPIKTSGSMSPAGVIYASAGGVDSTTFVATGRTRINYSIPYDAPNSYVGLCNGVAASGGPIYWTRPSFLAAAYMEIYTYFGLAFVFNPTNPSYIYFETREVSQ